MTEIKLGDTINLVPNGVNGIRITKDFAWFTFNGLDARELYEATFVTIYQLYDDNTESMITESDYDYIEWEDESLVFGIEIGTVEPEKRRRNMDVKTSNYLVKIEDSQLIAKVPENLDYLEVRALIANTSRNTPYSYDAKVYSDKLTQVLRIYGITLEPIDNIIVVIQGS